MSVALTAACAVADRVRSSLLTADDLYKPTEMAGTVADHELADDGDKTEEDETSTITEDRL